MVKKQNEKRTAEKEDGPNLLIAVKKQDWSKAVQEYKCKSGLNDQKQFRKTPKTTKHPKTRQIREKMEFTSLNISHATRYTQVRPAVPSV